MIIGTPPTYAPVVQDGDRLASKGWMSWFSAMARAFNGNWYKGTPTLKYTGGPVPVVNKLTMTPYHAMVYLKWDQSLTAGELVIDSVNFEYGIVKLVQGTTEYPTTINAAGNIEVPVILLNTSEITLTAICAVTGKEV